jgi:hypothetical protein
MVKGSVCPQTSDAPEDAMTAMITIDGPQDGHFIVRFSTRDGRSLSLGVPEAKAEVLRELQEHIPYGIAVRELVEVDAEGV